MAAYAFDFQRWPSEPRPSVFEDVGGGTLIFKDGGLYLSIFKDFGLCLLIFKGGGIGL